MSPWGDEIPYGQTQEDAKKRLIEVVRKGDLKGLRALLSQGVDFDFLDAEGRCPLEWSIRENHKMVMEILLSSGADLNMRNSQDQNLLMVAAQLGKFEMVEILIMHGVALDECDGRGKTALMHAILGGHVPTVKYLINHGADLEKTDFEGRTCIFYAIMCLDEKTIEALSFSRKDREVVQRLQVEMEKGSSKTYPQNLREISKEIIFQDADLNIFDDMDQTPIHYAAQAGDPETLMMLTKSGADWKAKNGEGKLPEDILRMQGLDGLVNTIQNLITELDDIKKGASGGQKSPSAGPGGPFGITKEDKKGFLAASSSDSENAAFLVKGKRERLNEAQALKKVETGSTGADAAVFENSGGDLDLGDQASTVRGKDNNNDKRVFAGDGESDDGKDSNAVVKGRDKINEVQKIRDEGGKDDLDANSVVKGGDKYNEIQKIGDNRREEDPNASTVVKGGDKINEVQKIREHDGDDEGALQDFMKFQDASESEIDDGSSLIKGNEETKYYDELLKVKGEDEANPEDQITKLSGREESSDGAEYISGGDYRERQKLKRKKELQEQIKMRAAAKNGEAEVIEEAKTKVKGSEETKFYDELVKVKGDHNGDLDPDGSKNGKEREPLSDGGLYNYRERKKLKRKKELQEQKTQKHQEKENLAPEESGGSNHEGSDGNKERGREKDKVKEKDKGRESPFAKNRISSKEQAEATDQGEEQGHRSINEGKENKREKIKEINKEHKTRGTTGERETDDPTEENGHPLMGQVKGSPADKGISSKSGTGSGSGHGQESLKGKLGNASVKDPNERASPFADLDSKRSAPGKVGDLLRMEKQKEESLSDYKVVKGEAGKGREDNLDFYKNKSGNHAPAAQQVNPADINKKNSQGLTPIMLAVIKGDLPLVRSMIDMGAEVDAKDYHGETVMMHAAKLGHEEIVKFLIPLIKNVDQKDAKGHTALALATIKNHPRVIVQLVEKEANLKISIKGMNLLIWAIHSGAIESIKVLMSLGLSPQEVDYRRRDAFSHAKQKGNKQIIKLLARWAEGHGIKVK